MTVAFNTQTFRETYPEFVNAAVYTDAQLNNYFTIASSYLNPNEGTYWTLADLTVALNLMVAHLTKSMAMIAAGQTTAVVSGATEGAVTITMEPPEAKTAFQYWLSTTPYGLQLRAFLASHQAGGFFVGGSLERSAFRKAGGVF